MKRFEWDDRKAEANLKKHGVTFGEATEVFEDPNAIFIPDFTNNEEERTWIIGWSQRKPKHLLVVFCDRSIDDKQEIYRLISARKITAKEKKRLAHL